MAKCASCRKRLPVPFWKYANLCPECQAARQSARTELRAELKQLTPALITTPALVGLNVLVFVLMAVSGVSFMEPTLQQLVKWGADFGPLTLGPQPWRLGTSLFVHIGLFHILFNMWCLWALGSLGERLLGNWKFLVLYLLSGAGGGILSLALHPNRVSAGASGAIFGVAGGVMAILYLKKAPVPSASVKPMLKSLAIFVGYNLLFGLQGGIDNSAHLGGLLTGLALGAVVPRRAAPTEIVPTGAPEPSSFNWLAAVLGCALLLAFGFVRHHYALAATAPQK